MFQCLRFSNRPLRFAIGLPATIENKENAHPYGSSNRDDSSNDSDQSDGPILYRDEPPVQEQRQAKIARKESLSLKLAMRPNVDELISRNILHMQSENERQESKEAIGARLIRRLSMRPTPEELIERNILKSSKTPPTNFLPLRSQWINHVSLRRSITSRGEKAEGGEEAVSAAKTKLPANRR